MSAWLNRLDRRLLPIQIGIVVAFALIPLWWRPLRLPIFTNLYVSRFALLLPLTWTITAWLAAGLPGWEGLRRGGWRAGWALALLTWALWGFASLLWAFMRVQHPEVGVTAALQFGVAALFAVVCACASPPPRVIAAVLVIGMGFNAALTIGQVAGQGWLGITALGEFPFSAGMSGVSLLRAGDLTFVRPYGLMPHPNALAGTLMIGGLAAGAWLLSARRGRRWLAVILMPLGVAGLLLTFSRAAWLAAGAGALLLLLVTLRYVYRQRQYWRAWTAAVLLTLMVGAGFLAQYRPFIAARAGDGEESVELRSVSDRLVFINFALRSFQERPIFGVGSGNFPWRTSYYIAETFYDLRGDNVHHVLLSALAELGIVGAGLLVAALICGSMALAKALRRASQPDDWLARCGLAAVFAALGVVGLLDHYPYTLLHFQVAWWGGLGVALSQQIK